jgi:hypothetical protein
MSIFAGKPTVSDDFHGMSTCAERDDHSVNRPNPGCGRFSIVLVEQSNGKSTPGRGADAPAWIPGRSNSVNSRLTWLDGLPLELQLVRGFTWGRADFRSVGPYFQRRFKK